MSLAIPSSRSAGRNAGKNTGRSPRLPVYRARRGRTKPKNRPCNLCQREFLAHSPFQRFCSHCREASELLHYYESMPYLAEHRA